MDEKEQKRLREEEEIVEWVGIGCFMFLIAATMLAGFIAACGG